MAQTLFSQLAQQTLAELSPASQAPQEAVDDPVSAILQVAQERGIDPANLLGLAKLETQAGRKTVKGDGADTLNLFNVKDFSKGGAGIRARDGAEGSNDRYRAYGSYRESVEDLAGLLERRYPGAVKAGSPEEFARELKRGGYATDPAYERKLASTIRSSGGASRPVEQPQEWDQGARYAPVGLAPRSVEDSKPAEKPSKRAGFWEGAADVGLSTAQGVVGSVKALTDLAGADNAASRGLDDASKGLEKFKSDASQQDRQYHQQKIKEAEASGDWKDEVAAYANMVWDMPLESLAQGVGSFATLGAGKVAQMAKLANAAKKAGVAKEAFLKTAQGIEAAKKAGDLGMKVNVGLGVGQGIGGVKGSQYEQTFNAAKESGLSDQQAQTLATEAQSYQQGWGQQALGAGLGYVAGKTGPIEKLAAGKTVGAGGVARRFVGGGLVEAGTEGLQGGQERYAGNAAAIDAGVLDESRRWAGVAGSGASEAITAGVLGGGAGALGRPDVDPQAQARAAAQQSGGIVSRAGLAATPGAQQPNPAAPNPAAPNPAAPNPAATQPTAAAAPGAAGQSDAGTAAGSAAAAAPTGNAAAAASPAQPAQTPIQASALSAIEQALEADKQRRRAAGEVVEDEVEESDVVAAQPAATTAGPAQPAAPQAAPTQPAAKPPLSDERDSMLPQAIDVLRQGGRPSISSIQRGLKIGYNRAARILEEMERDGVVGPMGSDGMRQVLNMPAPPGVQPTQPAQPASAGFSLPVFDSSPIPKMDPAAADEQRRQFAEFEQKRKNRRAGTRASAWERNPFMAFLGANGLNRDTAGEFAPGLTERRKAFVPGYGPVFRPGAKNLDELVQTAREDGFLRDDDGEPELYDLIDRALRGERIAPLFADGAAEAEGQRRQQAMQEREGATFEDYLAQQRAEMESDDFDPFTPMAESGYDDQDLDGTDFDQVDDDVRAEVAALSAHYADMGFDPSDVLERLALENENQPEQQFYDLAKTRLFQFIEQAQGQAEPAGNGDPRADDAQPTPAREEGGQGQAAAVTQPAAPAVASPKRADAIRAKLDDLKAQGFSQFTKSGGRTLLLNPDTYETVELTPAEKAVAKAAASQAKAGLQSLRGQRKPAQVDQRGADVLQSYTPADVLAQGEQAQAAKEQQIAEQQAAADQAKADDERKRIEQASYAAADSFELGQNPLDSLTGQQDIFSAAKPVAQDLAGERINDEWTAFDPQSGTLGIPRAEMPQIKAEHRGAMMGFLKARGIDGQQETIPAAAIKPTQAEFSPAKVKKAMDRQGGNRSIIVSADGYVVDGHHQWLAAREKGEPIPAIRLDQNIWDVLAALKDMPSAQPEQGGTSAQTYEQRNADRIARAKAADTQEAWDAITAEENADPERHFEGTDALRRAINGRRLDLKPDNGSFSIYPDRQQDAEAAATDSQYPLVTHTTKKGKVLRGYIVHGMTLDEVKASIDPYALKKDGGVFVREQHKDKLPKPAAGPAQVEVAASKPNEASGGFILRRPDSGKLIRDGITSQPLVYATREEAQAAADRIALNDRPPNFSNTMPAKPVVEANQAQEPAQQDSQAAAGQQWDGMTNAERVAIGLKAELPKAAANKWATREWRYIDAKVREKLAQAIGAGQEPDDSRVVYELPVDEAVFSDSLGELVRGEAERDKATFDPDIQRISLPRVTAASPKPPGVDFLPQEEANRVVQSWRDEAARQGQESSNYNRTVISLFDASGVMSAPWEEAGYNVVRYDIQNGDDINDFNAEMLLERHGNDNIWAIIAQPPCTDFASSGAQWWAEKDAKGLTEISNELVRQTMRTLELFRPPVWWLENPVGRMQRLNGLPDPVLSFDPWHFGDSWTKRTSYWGNFNPKVPTAMVEPVEGSKVHKLSSNAKFERSLTPEGVAYAMFMANNANAMTVPERLAREFPGIEAQLFERALAAGKTEQDIVGSIEDSFYENDLVGVREILAEMGQAEPTSQAATAAPSIITADDVAAAEKQVSQMIEARIDGMKAADVQRIAARFLPTMGVKVPTGKAKIKAAMTDATAMNLLGPAGELGIELSESVKRALVAKMEGRVEAGQPAQTQAAPEKKVSAPKWDAAKREDRRTLLSESGIRDQSSLDMLSKLPWNQLTDPIRKALDALNKTEATQQTEQAAATQTEGMTQAKAQQALENGQKLLHDGEEVWVDRVQSGAVDTYVIKRRDPDSPVVMTNGPAGPRGVQWGKQEAARKAVETMDLPAERTFEQAANNAGLEYIDRVMAEAKQQLEKLRNYQANAGSNAWTWDKKIAEAEQAVAAYQKVRDSMTGGKGSTSSQDADFQERLERANSRVPEGFEIRAEGNTVSLYLNGERTQYYGLNANDGGISEAVRQANRLFNESASSSQAIQDFIDGKRDMTPTLEEVQAEQAASPAAVNADLEAIFDQLDGLTQRTQANGQRAAAAHPQAERIQFVQKHILDILQDLEDSGKVTINC